MKRSLLAYARILGCGLLALTLGALSIDWLGTSWWSRAVALLTALSVMVFAAGREVPDGGA